MNDIEKAKKFYSEKLGISITEQGNMGFSLDIAGGNILSILSD